MLDAIDYAALFAVLMVVLYVMDSPHRWVASLIEDRVHSQDAFLCACLVFLGACMWTIRRSSFDGVNGNFTNPIGGTAGTDPQPRSGRHCYCHG